MLKFSVLLSVYEKERPAYLDRCLHSLWTEQVRRPDEIVLVKDGPLTPALDEVVEEWQGRLGAALVVVALPVNRGTGLAKNEGLQYCHFDWVAVMDTDDVALPQRFSKEIAYLEAHEDCEVLGAQVEEVTESGERRLKLTPVEDGDIRRFALRRNPFTHVTLFFKREMALALGGYRHHSYMEDYNICLRLMAAARQVHNLPDVLVKVRVDEDTMARRRGWTYVRSEWQLSQLKRELGLQSLGGAFFYFLLRSAPRLLPGSLMKYVYLVLRQKKGGSNEPKN